MKKLIIFIYGMLCAISLFSQKVVTVNAQIDTKYQVWTLDSIKLNEEGTDLYWHVESKGYTWCNILPDTYLKENNTQAKYYLKEIQGLALKPDSTVMQTFETIHFIEKFPVIDINTKIDYYASEDFFIKGLSLVTGKYTEIAKSYKYSKTLQDSLKLSDNLFECAIKLHDDKKYSEAIKMFKRVSEIDSLLFNNNWLDNPYYTNYAKQWIAHCYYKLGLDSIAKKYYYQKIEPINRKLVIKSDSLLKRFPTTYMTPNNKELYISTYKNICKLDSINLGKNNLRYIQSLCKLAGIYQTVNLYELSNSIYLHLLKNKMYADDNTTYSLDDSSYSKLLYNLSSNFYSLGNYYYSALCIEHLLRVKGEEEFYNITKDIIDPYSYQRSMLIKSYISIGKSEQALDILRKRVMLAETVASKDTLYRDAYSRAIKDYAETLSKLGYHKEALRNLKKIESNNWDLDIGLAYLNNYNYEKAEKHFLNAKQSVDKRDSYYELLFKNTVYENLAILEYRKDNIRKAIEYLEEIINLKKWEANAIENNTYFFSKGIFSSFDPTRISNLCLFYMLNNQPERAVELEQKNLLYKKEFLNTNDSEIGYSYINLGEAYSLKCEYEKALEFTKLGYDLILKDSLDTRRTLTNLVKFSYILNKSSEVEQYLLELNRINTKRIKSLFAELTSQEKKRFLDKDYKYFSDFLPKYTYLLNSNILKKKLYNSVLLSKGVLLSSDIGLRKIIENSNDPTLLENYYQLQFFKRSIIKEMENTGNEVIIDSLSNIANELEDSLIMNSKEYGNYMHKQSITWKDVKQQLSTKSIAIEFINFELDNDDKIYAALVLKNNYSCPKLIELFNSTSIEKLSIRDSYLTDSLDILIWEPLKDELRNVDNIYFSPSGLLHNIAIELCPSMKKKNLYRLSSTREIVTRENNKNDSKTAALFGGMKYNSKANYRELKYDFKSLTSTRGLDDIPDRGLSFSELPLTGVEIYNAKKFLKGSKYECFSFIGKDGIEESFKSLSGQNINWIHLATHGGYIAPETNRVKDNNYNFIIDLDKDIFSEDISLTHSFLAFSGCNSTLKRDSIPENSEDGILTAQEISQLDLSNLELVILSACKTGLGKISEDGVYGLQRGFKKAGAKSILMSLWDVNDKAAYDYMSFFYRYYAQKKNIKYAYDMAQENMRKKYPNNPEYWAAFILLDGV